MLNIALPKGRLGDKVYKMLEKIGYECPEILGDSRVLIFENEKSGVRYFLAKPSDVAVYVESGTADVGVVGKDILLEDGADVYELLDLGFGKCRFAVAAKNGYIEDYSRPVKVATKFVNTAAEYFRSINREFELIKLNGSVEIAPILGMSDVIFDLVETGKTLDENDLVVIKEVCPISARLIANKSSYQFKGAEIDKMTDALKKALA